MENKEKKKQCYDNFIEYIIYFLGILFLITGVILAFVVGDTFSSALIGFYIFVITSFVGSIVIGIARCAELLATNANIKQRTLDLLEMQFEYQIAQEKENADNSTAETAE